MNKFPIKIILTLAMITPVSSSAIFGFGKKKSKDKVIARQLKTTQQDDDNTGQIVVANWINMVNCLINIAANKENPAIVGQNVAQMVASFGAVVQEAFRRTSIRNNPVIQEQLEDFLALSAEDLSTLIIFMQNKATELQEQLLAQAQDGEIVLE